MEHFTPLTAALGGILIGLSATLLWVVNGRTAGISSIFGGIVPVQKGEVPWRLLFLIGLPIGAWLGAEYGPLVFPEIPTALPSVDVGPVALVAAGLFVGIGTRISRGCTSGHGICGLSRLSRRSFVAVGTFMATAALTVLVMRHVV